jgi:hypothetical protein
MTAASRILEADRQALWDERKEQGSEVLDGRQKARVWAIKALKPELTEQEWAAACRAVTECSAAFDAMRRAFDGDLVDCGGGSDFGLAARVTACQRLEGLRQAVTARVDRPRAGACVEWIAQLWTLPEIAAGLEMYRWTGSPRRRTPDIRPAKPFVRLVLIGMADYFDLIDRDKAHWAMGAENEKRR